jgi:acyl-ACP thioesterase
VADSVEPLVPLPPVGRRYSGSRKVRLGDVRPNGALRLDALTRYTQDVSNDDTTDAALPDDMVWVVRRTTVDVLRPAVFAESMTFTTFCSGLGRRWAERRLVVRGELGAHYEVATLWVHLDESTGRPRTLSDAFLDLYAEAAQGREVRAKLHNPPLPNAFTGVVWPTRAVDFDLFDHMNNAAYWAVVEEFLGNAPIELPYRCAIEYGGGIVPSDRVEVVQCEEAGVMDVWWVVDDAAVASVCIGPLGPLLYTS